MHHHLSVLFAVVLLVETMRRLALTMTLLMTHLILCRSTACGGHQAETMHLLSQRQLPRSRLR